MTQELKPASRQSRELAAQAWCEDGTKNIVMDERLAEAFARILDRQRSAGIILTGHQLLQALDFTAPDRDTDPGQLETELTLALGDETCHSGPGPYAWASDYPDEGAIALFDVPEDESASIDNGITFDDFVQYGIDNGGNVVDGMPCSFQYKGLPVSLENKDRYLVGPYAVSFYRGQRLVVANDGTISTFAAD